MPKMPKQGKAKRDGVINPQNYNFNEYLTRKITFEIMRQCFHVYSLWQYFSCCANVLTINSILTFERLLEKISF